MEATALWVSPTKRGDTGPTGTAARPAGPESVPYAELLTRLAKCPPGLLPAWPRAADIEERLEHLQGVLAALSDYLLAILDDTAQNVPGGLDLRSIDAHLCDLRSEVRGSLQRAADDLPVWGRHR